MPKKDTYQVTIADEKGIVDFWSFNARTPKTEAIKAVRNHYSKYPDYKVQVVPSCLWDYDKDGYCVRRNRETLRLALSQELDYQLDYWVDGLQVAPDNESTWSRVIEAVKLRVEESCWQWLKAQRERRPEGIGVKQQKGAAET